MVRTARSTRVGSDTKCKTIGLAALVPERHGQKIGDTMTKAKDRKNGDTKSAGNGNGAHLGFEAELFKAADKLRGNMEPSDYKHVALGLIFLKHISDSFEAKHAALMATDPEAAEDLDEYLAENI